MTDLEVVMAFGAALLALLVGLLWRRPRARVRKNVPKARVRKNVPKARVRKNVPKARVESGVPKGAIVVDGSNVMHWGGDPQARVVQRVVAALEAQGKVPIVFFDANAGYKLAGRFLDEAALSPLIGVPKKHILVVHKGVAADEYLLDFASEHGLSVVTNDRFRDWSVQHTWVRDHKRFRRGRWQEGSVVWTGKR